MNTKISAYQLFALMVLLPFGSAVLFFLTPNAKQDAWLALLIYIPVGMLMQLLYTSLFYNYPNDTIATYLPKIFGSFIGKLLCLMYILYFIYLAARVLRDFSELVLIVSVPQMPQYIVALIFMVTFTYGSFLGIENIARLAQLMLPIILITFIILFILLWASPGVMDFYNLKPILENGITSVIKSGWTLITFPFGETITFAMLYSAVNKPSSVRSTSLYSIIFLGIILALNTFMFIVTLGVTSASASLFPLFTALRLIKLGILDKLDIFVILLMVLGGFFKVSLFMYASMLGTAQLINIKDPAKLALPFGFVVLGLSMLIAKNYPEHIIIGLKWTPLYIHLPMQIVIPIAALAIHYLRKGIKRKSNTC